MHIRCQALRRSRNAWHCGSSSDPFDRMLIAQAHLEELTLVAHDGEIAKYDIAILDAGT